MIGPKAPASSHTSRLIGAMKLGCRSAQVRPALLPDSLLPFLNAPLVRKTRAVLFDIYGTLFSSSSGEVGSVASRATPDHFARAWDAVGIGALNVECAHRFHRAFYRAIRDEHARLRTSTDGAGPFPFPEIDIRDIWARTVSEIEPIDRFLSPTEIELLAATYESSINPTVPMPDVKMAIESIADRTVIGIVSNAQFYTRYLFPACLSLEMEDLGFLPRACAFSFEELRAKPDPLLFARPLAYLRECGIDSAEVLYVGNDMRNDIAAATEAGCMTALFAGDERSLRTREADPVTRGTAPTTVVQSLNALVGIVTPEKERS